MELFLYRGRPLSEGNNNISRKNNTKLGMANQIYFLVGGWVGSGRMVPGSPWTLDPFLLPRVLCI